MLIEESMHIAFDETNQNMLESVKTSADDEVPTRQMIDIELRNQSNKNAQMQKNQSIKLKIQSIES